VFTVRPVLRSAQPPPHFNAASFFTTTTTYATYHTPEIKERETTKLDINGGNLCAMLVFAALGAFTRRMGIIGA